MLLLQLQNDSLTARKARESDKALLLITLFSEAARIGKDDGNRETTDDEVLKVIRKFLKGVQETLDVLPAEKVEARAMAEFEKTILESYLPKMATEQELKAVIDATVAGLETKSPKQMGIVMKALKDKFAGAYDGNLASQLVKSALA